VWLLRDRQAHLVERILLEQRAPTPSSEM